MADFTGGDADDVFNAPVTSATTGAAATTVNSGDTIDGGAGNDTLTITATSANNNSLTGLVVSNIETVNIAGANNLGASSPAYAAALDAKALTAAALTSARAAVTLADGQSAAAAAVEVAVDTLGITLDASGVEQALANSTGAIETAVVLASTATAASAASLDAAARYFDAQILTAKQVLAASDAVAALSAGDLATERTAAGAATPTLTLPAGSPIFTLAQYSTAVLASSTTALAATAAATAATALVDAVKGLALSTNTISDTITTFTAADVRTVATQSQVAANGTAITTAPAILDRNAVLDGAYKAVNIVAASTGSTVLEAAQQKAAADDINTLVTGNANAVTALEAISASTWPTATFTALNTTNYTKAQYQAAAGNALKNYLGVTLTAATDVQVRAGELATAASNVNGVAGDFTIAQLNAAAANALVDANGATIRTAADDSEAIETRTDALVTIGAVAATAAADKAAVALVADTAAANSVTVALANVTATSIAATQFADATAITLSGSSSKASVTGVAATQTIGFKSVSSMANEVTFGATVAEGSLAVSASTGTLTVTGATMAALNISGTGSTALALVDKGDLVSATGADTIKTLNLSTSGTTAITTTGMTALTSVTQTGAGGVTLNSASTATQAKLASVTTGAGADNIRISTATAADNLGTTIDETVNASVSTGAGTDRVLVGTSGNGKTTVDAGEGNDTIILSSIGTGENSLSGGAGNDTFRIEGLSTIATTTISGGDGTDVLRTTQTGTFSATNYTTLVANVSSIETLQLAGSASVTLDASKVAVDRIEFLGSNTNTVTEVSSLQAVAAVRTPDAALSFGLGATTEAVVTNITASAKDYDADGTVANGNKTIFGDNLNIAMTHVAADATVVAKGNALTLSVAALGAVSADSTTAGANVTGIDSKVTLSGDVTSVTATLTSARGVGSVDAPLALGAENVAKFDIKLDADGETSTGTQVRTLGNLETVTVSGAGVVTIDTRTDLSSATDATAATLKTINLSGMTALADLNALGQEIGVIGSSSNAVGGYRNKSTSTVTLDNDVVETVVLGGAQDTVETASTYAKADTITGFQLVASATDPLVADAARSDVLSIAGGTTALSASTAAKMTVTGSTLEAALLQAASFKNAAGTDIENVVFNFGGDTYFFKDVITGGTAAQGLDDSDILVKMSGTLNLDLLLTSGVIIV